MKNFNSRSFYESISTMPVVGPSEISVKLYKTARRHTPYDHRIIDNLCLQYCSHVAIHTGFPLINVSTHNYLHYHH